MPVLAPNRDNVTTINEDGSRRFLHPAQVRGRFTNWRSLVGVVLIAIYAALPWIPINGNPAVFLDLEHRQFHYFGLTFVLQDLWVGFFLVSGLGFSLFFVTALLGRVWCGWACPQTVFLDVVHRIEGWFEGDAPQQRRLDEQPWTFEKMLRRGGKQLAFGLLSFLIAHIFLSYFVSLPRLYRMMTQAPGENWTSFVFVFLVTGALWFNFAWFREQFCIVLCPYGRLQSALIDNHSMVIGYDSNRGEPRGKKGTPGAGACVDCLRCVQVCPTGIDIRQGLQMECIGCAACIDACDLVMDKLQRPRGLIRYSSLNGLMGKATKIIRPRIILYTVLMAMGAVAMTLSLSTLRPATITVTRMPGVSYILTEAGVRNQYLVRVQNKRNQPQHFNLSVATSLPVQVSEIEGGVDVPAHGEQLTPLIVVLPRAEFHGPFKFEVVADIPGRGVIFRKAVPFIGPDK
jgi:cytochrome c oxidase accessory protein FixG